MKLYEAIGINPDKRECIAIVGAGGKTGTLFRLSEELRSHGKKVVATTSTKIFKPESSKYDDMLISEDHRECLDFAGKAAAPGIYVIGKSILEGNKLDGLDCSTINGLYRNKDIDFVIVEADGAKRKPLKAPGEHEPVIPDCATTVIGVIGLDAVGKLVSEENVHRSEAFCKLCGCNIGDVITEDMLIKMIEHPEGLFKGAPPECRRTVLLNKAEGARRLEAAEKIKKAFEKNSKYKVLSISLLKEACSMGAIILAAGRAERMGEQKLLMPIGNTSLVEHVIDCVKGSDLFEEIVLVYSNDEVKSLAEKMGLNTALNEHPEHGLSSSIKLGVKSLQGKHDAYMFFTGDQPFIEAELVEKLVAAYAEGKECIIVPKYGETNGMPTIFPCKYKEELLKLEGDVGGRMIIKNNPDKVRFIQLEQQEAGFDIDTREDYQKALQFKRKKL